MHGAILTDSVTTDYNMNQEVHRASHAVMQYVNQGHEPKSEVNWRGKDFYMYTSTEIGVPGDFMLWVGPRRENTVGLSGMMITFNDPQFDYHRAIVIWGMRSNTLDQLRNTVNSTAFIDTFEHEYLHLLDTDRTQTRINTRGESNSKDHDNYYNDPAEFNAYYHDIAKDIMAVIREVERDPGNAKDYFDLYNFTGVWQDDLLRLFDKSIYIRRFVKNLRPERRRALLRRLYRVYQEMMQVMREAALLTPG